MISVTDLRSGTTFEEKGVLYQVLSYEHTKMGRGSANIKIRVKNLSNGATLEKSFINGAKVKNIQLLKRDMQFLYKDSGNAYFMNPQNYEQVQFPLSKLKSEEKFLKEGLSYSLSFLNDEPLFLTLPPKIELKVTETDPGIKGNSASNMYKDATLDNGMRVRVPLFIKENDKVKIDTKTGGYTEKA